MPTTATDKTFSPTRRDPTKVLVENCVRSRAILDGLVAGCGASCRCPGCGETGFDTTSCRRCGYIHAVHCFSPAGGMMSPKPLHRVPLSPPREHQRSVFVPRLSPTLVTVSKDEPPPGSDRLPSVVDTIQGSPVVHISPKSPSLTTSLSPVREMRSLHGSPRVEAQLASVASSPRRLAVEITPLIIDDPIIGVVGSPVGSLRSQSPLRIRSPILQHCVDGMSCGSPVGSYDGVSVHYSPIRSHLQSPSPTASPFRSPRPERRDCSPIRQRVTINEKIVESDLRSLRKIRHVQQTAMECIWKSIRKDLLKRYFTNWTDWARVLQPDFWEEPGKAPQDTGTTQRKSLSPRRRASAGTQTQVASPGTPQTPSSPGTCFSQPQGTMKRSPRVRLRQQLFEESLDFLLAVTGVVCARIVVIKMQAVSFNGIWYKKGTPQPVYLSTGGELVGDLRLSIPPAPLPSPSIDSQSGLSAEQLEQLNETCTTGQKVFQPISTGGSKSESEHKDSVDLTAVAYSLGGSRYGILEPVSAGGRQGGADAPHRDIEDYRLPSTEGSLSADASLSSAAENAPSPGSVSPLRQMPGRPHKAQKVLSPKPTPLDHYLENRPDTPEKEITSSTQDKSSSYLTPQLNPESKHMGKKGTRPRQKALATSNPDSAPMPQLSTSSDPQDPDRHTSDPTIAASVARSDLSIAGAVATSIAVKSLVASIGKEVASLGVSQSAISQISLLNLNESTDSADVLARSAPSPRSRTTPGVDDIVPVPHALTPKAKPCTHLPAKPRRPGSKKLGNQAYPPEEVLDRSGASLSQFNSDDMSGQTDDDGLPPFTPPQSALSTALFPRRVPPSTVTTEPVAQELTIADSIDLDPNEGKLPPPVRRPLSVTSPDQRWKSHGGVGVGVGGIMSTHSTPGSVVNSSRYQNQTPTSNVSISQTITFKKSNFWDPHHTSTPLHYPDDRPSSTPRATTDARTPATGKHVRVMEFGHVSPLRRRRNVTVSGPPKRNQSATSTAGIRIVSQQSSRESPKRMAMPVSDVADHVAAAELMEERGKQDALLLEIDRLRSENLALRMAQSEVPTPPVPVSIETPTPVVVHQPVLPPPPPPPPPVPPPVSVVHVPTVDVDPHTSPHRDPPAIVLPVFNPRDFRSERSHERYR
eukprot:TRINITY_DN14722_c0_g1_i1.p1 TRINITY_DN14722_c0_g1~~TRINITY_DN14722_c0_g1_i1.p1  ORF type:complete len:1147 (+),score=180.93 TRINITY_DN14722_c0_g1_i1:64-3504(+)